MRLTNLYADNNGRMFCLKKDAEDSVSLIDPRGHLQAVNRGFFAANFRHVENYAGQNRHILRMIREHGASRI